MSLLKRLQPHRNVSTTNRNTSAEMQLSKDVEFHDDDEQEQHGSSHANGNGVGDPSAVLSATMQEKQETAAVIKHTHHNHHHQNKRWHYKYFMAGVCFILKAASIFVGSLIGNYTPYIASLFTNKQLNITADTNINLSSIKSKYNANIDAISWAYSICMVFMYICMSVGGVIEHKCGPKFVVCLGSVISISGWVLTYFVIEYTTNVWYFYASFAMLCGIGTGLVSTTPFIIGYRWFEEHSHPTQPHSQSQARSQNKTQAGDLSLNYSHISLEDEHGHGDEDDEVTEANAKPESNRAALIAGLIMAGQTISMAVFNILVTEFINPDNKPIDQDIGFVMHPDVLDRISTSFLKMAAIIVMIDVFCIVFLKNPPYFDSNKSNNQNNQNTAAKVRAQQQQQQQQQKYTSKYSYDGDDNNDHSGHSGVLCAAKNDTITKKENKKTKNNKRGERRSLMSCDVMSVDYYKLSSNVNRNISVKEVLLDTIFKKDLLFWNLFFTVMCLPTTYVNSQWKTLNVSYLGIENDNVLAAMVSFAYVCNTIARVGWGFMYDKISTYARAKTTENENENENANSNEKEQRLLNKYDLNNNGFAYKRVLGVASVCLVLFIGTWMQLKFVGEYNQTLMIVMSFIWLAALQSCTASVFVVMPMFMTERYGSELGAAIYGLLFLGSTLSTLTAMFAITELRNMFGWLYMNYFWVFTQCCFVALVVTSDWKCWRKGENRH